MLFVSNVLKFSSEICYSFLQKIGTRMTIQIPTELKIVP